MFTFGYSCIVVILCEQNTKVGISLDKGTFLAARDFFKSDIMCRSLSSCASLLFTVTTMPGYFQDRLFTRLRRGKPNKNK